MPGLCEPQLLKAGTASGEGGQGRFAVKLVWQNAEGGGASGTSDEKAAFEAVPSGAIRTSQDPSASDPHGSLRFNTIAL
jgi:hypothetical protein